MSEFIATKKQKKHSTYRPSVVKEGQIIGQLPKELTRPAIQQASRRTTILFQTLVTAAICLTLIAIIQQSRTSSPSFIETPAPTTTTFTQMQLPDTPPPDVFIFPDNEIEL